MPGGLNDRSLFLTVLGLEFQEQDADKLDFCWEPLGMPSHFIVVLQGYQSSWT